MPDGLEGASVNSGVSESQPSMALTVRNERGLACGGVYYVQARYYCDKCGKELDAFAGNILPLKSAIPIEDEDESRI